MNIRTVTLIGIGFSLLMATQGAALAGPLTDARTSPPRVPGDVTPGTSLNWVGYGAVNTTFTSVKAHWVQPTVDCAGTPSGAFGMEVGLDGVASATAEQVGSVAYCHDGAVSYFDWWGMFPATPAPQTVNTVHPGDNMSGSVSFASGIFTLSVTDASDPPASFTITETCTGQCPRSSAVWVGDTEQLTASLVAPLADFGMASFSKASATSAAGHTGPIDDPAWNAFNFTMIDWAGQHRAEASDLNGKRNAFTASWLSP